MKHTIAVSIATLLFTFMFACANNDGGLMEGRIGDSYVIVNSSQAIAIPINTTGVQSNYIQTQGTFPSVSGQSMTILLEGKSNIPGLNASLKITVLNTGIIMQAPQQLIGVNILATLYVTDSSSGAQQQFEATSGTMVFREIGFIRGQRMAGEFNFQFSQDTALAGYVFATIGNG